MTETADHKRAAMRAPRSLTLSRSRIVMTYDEDFSVEDTIAAQRAAGKQSALFPLYLAQRVASFDGRHLTIGELRETIRGKDYLQMVAALLGDADGEPAEDGDDAGKPRPN